MTKHYTVWLQVEEEPHAAEVPDDPDPRRLLLATFETEEQAGIFMTEIRRKYSPKASGEGDVAGSMGARDQFTPG